MKPILLIEKSNAVGPYGEYNYFSVSDSKTNKNWIVQYNTTLRELIHYAMGYAEAKDYDHNLYFGESVSHKDLEAAGYPELLLNKITEQDFQRIRAKLSSEVQK